MRPKFGLLSSLLIAMMIPMSAATGAEEPSMNTSAKALHALFRAEWDYRMEQSPTWASVLGDRRWNDRWPDLNVGAIRRRQEHNIEALAKLKSIERSQLSRQDQLSYDLFQKEYEIRIEQHQYGLYFIPLNQLGGIQTANELADALRFETLKDYEDWTARLRALPVYMDQTIALMREGMSTRIVLPKIILQRVPAQIDKQIVEAPEASPFYKPFNQFPALFSAADRERLVESAKRAIASEVVPAYRRFKEFFVTKYIAASFDQVGAWQMPNGEPLYAFLARKYTTTSLTPKEIHEIGLREVKRIRGEMEAIIDKVGFKGTFAEFLEFLRSDPRFYYKTPDELLAAYQALTRRIDPHLVKLFKTLPRMPYGVDPIPAAIAADTTTAYYRSPAADGSRAGTYFVNIYKPEVRPKYEMMALSLHEAVPGHHLQITLAMEQDGLPNFRRYGGYTAFVEGWALYAESLGDELGLYDDSYSKFGQLTYEMWRAVRLVVDTGIHHMRWDRQRAIRFLMENAAKQEHDVVNEVDRYIASPGQALAYKVGELKIKELRARASRALGDRFDVREFHDAVLRGGAVPLDVLEQTIEEWLNSKK